MFNGHTNFPFEPSVDVQHPTAPSRTDKILQMVHRIDQHLDVVEEKIDSSPVQSPEIARQLDTQLREMETMKAMMEAMRFEKEQAKKKAEEEAVAAKLRAEQEEASALSVFRKESEMKLHGILHQNQTQSYGIHIHRCRSLFLEMDKSGEILLELLAGKTLQGYSSGCEFIITDRHIYYVVCTKDDYSNTQFKHISKLYSFHAPLNSSQCKLLKSALESTDCPTQIPLKTRICFSMSSGTLQPTIPSELAYHRKKFESVVRIIPGSYQNGDWRQLDGFFGMYYNENTMEVSEYPPLSQ